jgi:transcriptional regulator with PAS, ATPase and Fis domain
MTTQPASFPLEALGNSRPIQELLQQLSLVSQSSSPVLIEGETGTGKELLVKAIHERSPRSHLPMVVVSCATVTASLAESAFFGHARGAFTGAYEDRKGFFEQAHGGTLLLDGVEMLDPHVQGLLLRILEDGKVRLVGAPSRESTKVDVRILATCQGSLREEVRRGRLREDLFFRLAVLRLTIPPLRERPEDIGHLLQLFLREETERQGRRSPSLAPETEEALLAYPWPGNLRQLKAVIHRLCLEATDPIPFSMLPAEIREARRRETLSLRDRLRSFERRAISDALAAAGHNLSRCARLLGLPRTTLLARMRALGMTGTPT